MSNTHTMSQAKNSKPLNLNKTSEASQYSEASFLGQELKSWISDYKSALKTLDDINQFFDYQFDHTDYPVFIPHSLAKKIKETGIHGPLGKLYLPHINENNKEGEIDPIGDQVHQKTKQIIHRYKNRVLFLVTTTCPVICRHCFRKNELTTNIFKDNIQESIDYISKHQEVNEVIFSGGDPFILSNKRLDEILKLITKIPHIKYIRFHTKIITTIPNRFDNELNSLLLTWKKHFNQVNVVMHINHITELDSHSLKVIHNLNKQGINLLSQTVLLKDINSDSKTLITLFEKLNEIKVRPYYLHHPDKVQGGMHFRISLQQGRSIYHNLRTNLPGWSLPQYIIEIPNGGGKTMAYNPQSLNDESSFLSPFNSFDTEDD